MIIKNIEQKVQNVSFCKTTFKRKEQNLPGYLSISMFKRNTYRTNSARHSDYARRW